MGRPTTHDWLLYVEKESCNKADDERTTTRPYRVNLYGSWSPRLKESWMSKTPRKYTSYVREGVFRWIVRTIKQCQTFRRIECVIQKSLSPFTVSIKDHHNKFILLYFRKDTTQRVGLEQVIDLNLQLRFLTWPYAKFAHFICLQLRLSDSNIKIKECVSETTVLVG